MSNKGKLLTLIIMVLCFCSNLCSKEKCTEEDEYRQFSFSLPIYKMKSRTNDSLLYEITRPESKEDLSWMFIEIYYSNYRDTIYSREDGFTPIGSYNVYITGFEPQHSGWDGYKIAKNAIGCSKIGRQWFLIYDTLTANTLFDKTDSKHKFSLSLANRGCICPIQNWLCLIDEDTVINYNDFNIIHTGLFPGLSSNPDSVAKSLFTPIKADSLILRPDYCKANYETEKKLNSHLQWPDDAPDEMTEYFCKIKLIVEKDCTVSEIVFEDSAFVKIVNDKTKYRHAIETLPCFKNEIRKCVSLMEDAHDIAPLTKNGHIVKGVLRTTILFSKSLLRKND